MHHGGPLDGVSQKFDLEFVPTSVLFGKNGRWEGEYRRDETAPIHEGEVDVYRHEL